MNKLNIDLISIINHNLLMNIKLLNKKQKEGGFTLVELLVVIGIIAILATILLLQLGTARAKGRDAKRISDMNQIRTALELYFDDNSTYPAALTELVPATGNKYLQKLPTDPLPGKSYTYCASGTQYQVSAQLEQYNNALKNDADINRAAPCVNGGGDDAVTDCSTNSCYFDLGQ